MPAGDRACPNHTAIVCGFSRQFIQQTKKEKKGPIEGAIFVPRVVFDRLFKKIEKRLGKDFCR
jgi:hypothetical protein